MSLKYDDVTDFIRLHFSLLGSTLGVTKTELQVSDGGICDYVVCVLGFLSNC